MGLRKGVGGRWPLREEAQPVCWPRRYSEMLLGGAPPTILLLSPGGWRVLGSHPPNVLTQRVKSLPILLFRMTCVPSDSLPEAG